MDEEYFICMGPGAGSILLLIMGNAGFPVSLFTQVFFPEVFQDLFG